MGRPRKFDEQEVVAAARRVFWEQGYHGASVGDIAAAAGLGKGSLYGAFGDKHQLYLRIFEEYCAASDASAAALANGPDETALERAEAWLLAGARNSDRTGCLLAKGTAELSGEDDAVAEGALRTFSRLHAALTEVIRGAQRAGDVAADADPEAVGGLILAAHRGIEALGKAGMTAETLVPIAEQAIAAIRD
jgi:TetR/AcrR family transcriptional regulator, transcriptional repressor for nem operon